MAVNVFLNKSLKNFCTTPLKNNSSTTAGITASTKLTPNNSDKELLVNNFLLSASDNSCTFLNISSPWKCKELFHICNKSFKGMLAKGISIAQRYQRLLFREEKERLKFVMNNFMQTKLESPKINIEPKACMHKLPALLWLNRGKR